MAKRRPDRQRLRGDRARKISEHDEGRDPQEGGRGRRVHVHRKQQQRHSAGHQHCQDLTQL